MTLDPSNKDVCCINYTFMHDNNYLHHIGELPVTIDLARYDRDSGNHNITIMADSTTGGEVADYTYTFLIPGVHQ